MKKRFNQRVQELSIGTLILIVLGIIVLVLLVLGFSIGWKNLFSKKRIAQGGDLSEMVASCKIASASNSIASYCELKDVKIGGVSKKISCADPQIEAALGFGARKIDCTGFSNLELIELSCETSGYDSIGEYLIAGYEVKPDTYSKPASGQSGCFKTDTGKVVINLDRESNNLERYLDDSKLTNGNKPGKDYAIYSLGGISERISAGKVCCLIQK